MDFPIFHAEFMGNRTLIAVIATLHVLINHGLAVGMMPLVAAMEWQGVQSGDKRWDQLAYKLLFVAFILTTTVGALTGVGIWLSAALVNPDAIGSLIRVFFWAWFTEWLVFITEVGLILAYFLTWKRWKEGEAKLWHIRLGFMLSLFSWITMAIIVAILGFMMDPGNWLANRAFLSGVLNPIYLPQLAFRTPLALAMAGIIAAFLTLFFVRREDPFRRDALRALNLWVLFWAPVALGGGLWYASVIPSAMLDNLGTALLTLPFETWKNELLMLMAAVALGLLLLAQVAVYRPQWAPAPAYAVAFVAIVWLTGHFERVREFIRKPYVIGRYMFANGIRVSDYPLLSREGLLRHATYSYPLSEREAGGAPVSALARLQQGKDVFMLTCTRCHTGTGANSVLSRFETLFGNGAWDPEALAAYTRNMHDVRPYMPPFPGTEDELLALSDYLVRLHENGAAVAGVQETGVQINRRNAAASVPRPPRTAEVQP